MKKNPLVINFAVIIIRKIELYEHIIRYLHKFNVTNILIIKRKGLKTNTKILKKYKISYDIVKSYENKNIYENLIIYKKKLPIFFFHLNSENFLNQNLFDLKEVIRRNPNKLIYFKNNSLIPSIKVFNKNRLNFYQKVEKKKFLNKNCKIISFKKKDLLVLHKDQNKKKIQKFFKKIYSKNLILDRDGVINKNLGYVSEISDLKWVNGFIKAI